MVVECVVVTVFVVIITEAGWCVQGVASYCPRAKFGLPRVFVNTVLIGESHAFSFAYCLCLLSHYSRRAKWL